jgi:hypothetical protein
MATRLMRWEVIGASRQPTAYSLEPEEKEEKKSEGRDAERREAA